MHPDESWHVIGASDVYIESAELVGSVRRTDGTTVVFVRPSGDDPTGVREPRRPHPAAPATALAARP